MSEDARYKKFKELVEDNVLSEETIATLPSHIVKHQLDSKQSIDNMCMTTYFDGDYFHTYIFIDGNISDITLFQDCFNLPTKLLNFEQLFSPYFLRLHKELQS